jgi:hypothetical protein
VICPNCQAENGAGVKFCIECGAPLALRCPDCGASHEAAQKFCGECGRALISSSPLPPAGIAAAAGGSAAVTSPAAATAARPTGAAVDQSAAGAAEMRLVSVLFVDLVGFTSLSLRDAIARFAELGYPYWLSVARTDLAEWLAGQATREDQAGRTEDPAVRAHEASALLSEAIPVLQALGARPALERAQALRAAMASADEALTPSGTSAAPPAS